MAGKLRATTQTPTHTIEEENKDETHQDDSKQEKDSDQPRQNKQLSVTKM